MPKDPRLIQITILSTLVLSGFVTERVAVVWPMAWVAFIGCQIVAFIGHWWRVGGSLYANVRGYSVDLMLSPLITSLSLTLLLRTHEFWVMALAVCVAIGSKFVLRVGNSHIFNPANIGIVTALLLTDAAWISPGQWGQSTIIAVLLVCAAGALLSRAGSWDVSAMFLGSYALLLVIRAWWLGDPMAIPFHQLQSGTLLIFTFFMISDPKTIPQTRKGRAVFALLVAAVAYWMQLELYIREGLIYALFIIAALRFFSLQLSEHFRTLYRSPASQESA